MSQFSEKKKYDQITKQNGISNGFANFFKDFTT